MKKIYRKISLEPFKCRVPNTIISFKGDSIFYLYDEIYYGKTPNGNYNLVPSDLHIPSKFTSETRVYDFTTITDVLSTSINVPQVLFGDTDGGQATYYYNKQKISGYSISTYEEDFNTEEYAWSGYNNYMSYRKIREWYLFYKMYFGLLKDISCKNSDRVFKSAVEYYNAYYIDNDDYKKSDYEKLDELFIKRGGTFDESGNPKCDFYDWLNDYVFLEYDIEDGVITYNGETIYLKKYAKEWKNTRLNIISLMQWFKWFEIRYEKYSEVTDCHLMDEDNTDDTDCCDCAEYFRLGGNYMYFFLKECIGDLEEKCEAVKPLCTYAATMNIQIPILNTINNIGEFSLLYEDWEGGVDYTPNTTALVGDNETPMSQFISEDANLWTTIHYGGDSFNNEQDNDIITLEDNIYISSRNDYYHIQGHPETAKGYYYNKYKELGFVASGHTMYQEYLPYYIQQHPEEFRTQDNITATTYAYSKYKYVVDPTPQKMAQQYSISSRTDCNIFYIDGEIIESFNVNLILDYQGHEIQGQYGPIYVEYIDGNNVPYITYRNTKYFGYYFKDEKTHQGRYRFTFKHIPKYDSDWYVMSDTKTEFIRYNRALYRVQNDMVSLSKDGIKYTYSSIKGYLLNSDGDVILVGNDDGNYFCGKLELKDNYTFGVVEDNNTEFKQRIEDLNEWDTEKGQSGYWIEKNGDTFTLFYVEPYVTYQLGEVTGTCRSRLNDLVDFNRTYDKLGNTLNGIYCGTKLMPTDKDMLDIPYHVGNTRSLEFIVEEVDEESIVYDESKSDFTDFYWGNLISNIRFYYLDNNGNIMRDKDGTLMEKEIPHNFINCPADEDEKYISNLDYIKDCFKLRIGDITNKQNLFAGNVTISGKNYIEIEEVSYNTSNKLDISNFKVVDFKSAFQKIPNMYCEIKYSIGGIIQKSWRNEGSSTVGKYVYGQYNLTKNYHKGVEYTETFIVGIDSEKYYEENEKFHEVYYFTLTPTQPLEYYMDEQPDDDSDAYISNTASFRMETSYNFLRDLDETDIKYSKELNSSHADGRQLNFYNGLMASPLFMEEYKIGTTSLRNKEADIYVDRGSNYNFDKHLKLLEIRTFEALEQYGNGFYNIINNNE